MLVKGATGGGDGVNPSLNLYSGRFAIDTYGGIPYAFDDINNSNSSENSVSTINTCAS